MPKSFNTEAIVLKHINYKDSNKIYTLFTKEKGKIGAMARGVRKISSRRSGNLDTLNHISVKLLDNKGLKIITEVKTLQTSKKLKLNLQDSSKAYYLLELIYRFLPEEEPNHEVFNLLVATLSRLNVSESDLKSLVIINSFEVELMKLLGYKMELVKCANCEKKLSTDWEIFKFNTNLGGFVCNGCNMFGVNVKKETVKALALISSFHKRADLQGNTDSGVGVSKDAIITGNELIKHYIKEVMEENINSVRVFKGV